MITEVKLNDAFIARILLEFFVFHTMFWIVIFILSQAGHNSRIESMPGVLYAFITLMFFSGGVGLCSAAICGIFPPFKGIISASMRIVMLISGVFFSILIFPSHIRGYLEWNPFLHILEYMRSSYFPVYESYLTQGSLAYVWKITAVLWMFGLILIRRMRARMLER